jgi:hypothetical protein
VDDLHEDIPAARYGPADTSRHRASDGHQRRPDHPIGRHIAENRALYNLGQA